MRWSRFRVIVAIVACLRLAAGRAEALEEVALSDGPRPETAAGAPEGTGERAIAEISERENPDPEPTARSLALDEVVVTATRGKSFWKDAPAMVTVVEKEELARAPEKTLDDFLRRIPSVATSRIHAAECGPGRDITLRGIPDQKRTLILVDGIPVNDGVTGAVNWSMVPKEAVERIEVVRGPMSALYGSGAMGGVVNIITRKPREANETLVKGGYGNLNSFSGTLLQGGNFDRAGYWVGGNFFRTDGYVQAEGGREYLTENARTDYSLLGRAFVLPDPHSLLTLGANHVNEDYSRGIRTDNQINATTAVNAVYERELSVDVHLSAAAYAQFMSREVELGARPAYAVLDHTEFDDMMKFGELLQTDFPLAGFNTITVGIDTAYAEMYKHNDYARLDRQASAAGNQLLASVFAQDEMRFAGGNHKAFLTPGLRVDYSLSGNGENRDTNPAPNPPVNEHYPDRSRVAVNPKLALVYRYADATTLRAAVGRSFAAPTLFELYTVFTRGPLLLYGNPELDPESAWSGEVGLDQWLLPNLLGRLSVYYTRGRNFIGYRTIAANQLRLDNITEVQSLGLDSEFRYDLNRMWTLYGGYTWNRSTVLEDAAAPAIEGNRLPFEPLHRARIGLVFAYAQWLSADFSARYEGERYTDVENTERALLRDYVSLDLGLSGAISRSLSWMLAFENLLDERYDVYSVPTEKSVAPGFLVNGYLTLAF